MQIRADLSFFNVFYYVFHNSLNKEQLKGCSSSQLKGCSSSTFPYARRRVNIVSTLAIFKFKV